MSRETRRPYVNVAGLIPDLATLPADILDKLGEIAQIRKFEAGQVLAASGAELDMVGFVISGILRMQKTLFDGRQHVVGLLVKGDMFGRVFDVSMQFALEGATDSAVLSFRRESFEALLSQSPELERLILLRFLSEIDRSRDWMIILSNPRVRGRLAGFLLMLCTRFRHVEKLFGTMNGRLTIRIPIGRADVAQLLGARPESVSRAFHALAADGLLEIIRPDLVAVDSIEDLAEEAGEPELVDMIDHDTLMQPLARAFH